VGVCTLAHHGRWRRDIRLAAPRANDAAMQLAQPVLRQPISAFVADNVESRPALGRLPALLATSGYVDEGNSRARGH